MDEDRKGGGGREGEKEQGREQGREREWKKERKLLIKVNSTGKFAFKLYVSLNYFFLGGGAVRGANGL